MNTSITGDSVVAVKYMPRHSGEPVVAYFDTTAEAVVYERMVTGSGYEPYWQWL